VLLRFGSILLFHNELLVIRYVFVLAVDFKSSFSISGFDARQFTNHIFSQFGFRSVLEFFWIVQVACDCLLRMRICGFFFLVQEFVAYLLLKVVLFYSLSLFFSHLLSYVLCPPVICIISFLFYSMHNKVSYIICASFA
jgi:hypothetical protein